MDYEDLIIKEVCCKLSKDTIFLKVAHSTKEWLKFIDSLQPPKDDYDRTKYHYTCTCLYNSKKEIIVYQIISLLLFPISFFVQALFHYLQEKKRM